MGVSRSLSNLHHTMLFTVVKLLLLPSALGLVVRFPPVQKVPEDAPKALSSDPESDAYIDQILANLATVIIENGLDPATLPDADTGFSDTILGITFHGSAHLFNGRFWRLSTIHRTGDTSFTVDGTKVRLTANIGVEAPPPTTMPQRSSWASGCPPGSRQTLQTLEYTLTLRFVKIRNSLALPILFPDGRCQRGRT